MCGVSEAIILSHILKYIAIERIDGWLFNEFGLDLITIVAIFQASLIAFDEYNHFLKRLFGIKKTS